MSTGFDDGDALLEAYLAESGEADLAEEAPPRLWEDGRTVGDWTVTGFLARGGNAEVYCAKHRRLGTRVALKVLWRGGDAPRVRFDRETRFLMENRLPSFPAFCGAGEEDGRPWVAMELLDECPLPETDAAVARYLDDAGRAVAALHARGWLHRDLKPRNILRRADGHAVLADFGLLKAIDDDVTAVAPDSPSVVDGREVGVGTPGYSAPEQFSGTGATVAADVYALGMLAEECFCGHPPRAWEKIIRRATAALPRQRYPDVASLLRAIRHRHRVRTLFRAGTAALLAGLLGAWWWSAWRENAPPATVAPRHPAPPETPEIPEEPEAPAPAEACTTPEVAAVPTDIRAARSAALARFEAEEWRKAAILSLVADMRTIPPSRIRWSRGTCRVGLHEVTQRQWTALMDGNPSRFRGDDLPVDSLTAEACREFLERLNATSVVRSEDLVFRLPAAWEWQELADDVRPGTPGGRLEAGWFAENSGGRTHPVGEKAEDGAFADLFGNVRELTSSRGGRDGKEGFACMGGSWADSAAGESLPVAVLEDSGSAPPVACPAPGEIGFRLWADPRTPPANPLQETAKQAREHWEGNE